MYVKIKVGSVTNAQRGARILKAYGYKPIVTRLENPGANDGCGFVIELYDEKNKAVSILKSKNIRVIGVET